MAIKQRRRNFATTSKKQKDKMPASMRAFLFCVALYIVNCAAAMGENEPRFTITASMGFEDTYKENCWTPMRIHIVNQDHFSGPVVLRVDMERGGCSAPHGRVLRRYRMQAILDGASESTFTMGVRATETTNKCWVYLLDQRQEDAGAIAPRQVVDGKCATGNCPLIRPQDLPKVERVLHAISCNDLMGKKDPSWTPIIMAVNPSPSLKEIIGVSTLPHNKGMCSACTVSAAELTPLMGGYESFSAIILDEMRETTLTAAQIRVLRDYVFSGGLLALTRSCLESPLGLELMRQFPIKTSITGPAVLSEWGEAASFLSVEPQSMAPIELLPMDLASSFFTVSANEGPMIASHRFCKGTLALLPFRTADIQCTSGNARAVQERVWGRVLENMPAYISRFCPSRPIASKTADIRQLIFPYLAFVVLSALCLGPLCTLLTRARNRRIYALWLLPVLAAVLCGLAFTTALYFRGSAPHVESVTLIQGDVNVPTGLLEEYVGIMSGAPGTYTFGPLPVDSVPKENFEGSYRESDIVGLFPPTVDVGADGIAVTDLHFNRWSMRFFRNERIIDVPPLSGQLQATGEHIVGWVKNESEYPIEAATLLFKWNRLSLGLLAPGQQVPIDLILTDPPKTVRVYSPYTASFNEVSSPLNPAHWPDTPYTYGITEILESKGSWDTPTILGLLPVDILPDTPIQGINKICTQGKTVIGQWRLPIERAPVPQSGLPSPLSVARDNFDDTWPYVMRLGQWESDFTISFPPINIPYSSSLQITLHTRLTDKSLKEYTDADKVKVKFYDWTIQDYSDEIEIQIGDTTIPDSARFIRPGDFKILIQLKLTGAKAEKYGHFEVDRLECSIREAGQ